MQVVAVAESQGRRGQDDRRARPRRSRAGARRAHPGGRPRPAGQRHDRARPGPTTATVADVLDDPPPPWCAARSRPAAGARASTCWSAPSRPSGTTTPIRGATQLRPPAPARCDRLAPDTRRPRDGGAASEPYRLVIVDCPPSLGQLTRSALAAAHRAVLVTDPTMFAVSGVQRAFDAVQTERERGNPDLQPLGVLINRVRPRNTEHEFRIAELRELFGPLVFTGVLPDRSADPAGPGRVPAHPAVGHPRRPGGLRGVHHPARARAAHAGAGGTCTTGRTRLTRTQRPRWRPRRRRRGRRSPGPARGRPLGDARR